MPVAPWFVGAQTRTAQNRAGQNHSSLSRITRTAVSLTAVVALLLIAVGVTPPSARADPASADAYATLALTEVTPSTITSSTGDTVTVSGRIVNTTDQPITDVTARLQRAEPVHESYQLRSALTAPAGEYGVAAPSRRVANRIGPHKSADFTVSVSVRSLALNRAGVYPLLVDVVGSPQGGGVVTIAESRTLLPVLSLPADKSRARDFVEPGSGVAADPLLGRDGSLAPNTSSPAALTMLWPLAASPQEAAGVLGGGTSELRLTNDSLSHSLQRDGRLGLALSALEELTGTREDGGGAEDDPVRDALCLAVDPDLLTTVSAMSDGYAITTDPADPEASTHEGQGASTAASWLRRLTRVAARMCVTALPYAQAGLDSLATVAEPQLSERAVLRPYDVVDSVLGVRSVRGMTVPATGTLTTAGRDLLAGLRVRAAAVASTSLQPISPADRSPTSGIPSGRYGVGSLSVQSYDAAVSAALGATGITPVVPGIMPNWQQPHLTDESAASRRQTALAALAFPMLSAPPPVTDDGAPPDRRLPTTGRSAFVMPPTYWSPTVDDARALHSTASLLIASGTARPVPFATVVDQMPSASAPAHLEVPGDVTPSAAAGRPVSESEASAVRERVTAVDRMQAALVGTADTVTTPATYMAPLRDDLLRALSSASTTDAGIAGHPRRERLTAVAVTLRHMREAVGLLDPSGRYTLASERSPLLLVVRNSLALPIRVRLDIDAPDTLEIGDLGTFEIPANGTRQLQIPTHASSSEPAKVHISLVTSSEVPLSAPVELSVYANAYGKPLFWITIGAAIVLILLTARRLWHRFTGEPDPADEDRPEPDEHELELATLTYQQRLAAERAEPGLVETDVNVDGSAATASDDGEAATDEERR
ncbi:DUF6049 family protein [Gordonia shandongensis]|uniref:DUF6049 family protein n=1 Tax=Gordonia shandongensis TaxID=376351 RepID=UPI000424404B|nr:DUF6049 family protein [Gordonia shandongensis]